MYELTYVQICRYVFVSVCMYVCMYACMYLCVFLCKRFTFLISKKSGLAGIRAAAKRSRATAITLNPKRFLVRVVLGWAACESAARRPRPPGP